MNNRLRFMKNEYIEDVTAQRIRVYEERVNDPVKLPVPVEQIVEQTLDLSILWDEVEEQQGEMILGGLQPKTRTIILNEKHLPLFDEKPGLLRSTIGHEAGHWDIDVDKTKLQSPSLFDDGGDDRIAHRHTSKSDQLIEVLLDLAMHNEKAYRVYKQLTAGQDTAEQKSAVDRYQSALLMPKWLMKEADQRFDFTQWKELYRLAEEAEVTISNLVTRLRRLGMIYIPKGTKMIYRSKDEYRGQKSLF